MGSDAEIYEFDFDRYTREVVPAFRQLLLTGELAPWLQEVRAEKAAYFGMPFDDFDVVRLRNTDLIRHCTYLRPNDLAFLGNRFELGGWASWKERSCKSEACPDRLWCPFHQSVPDLVIEDVAVLLEDAVEARCLLRGQFVGRTMSADRYGLLLSALGVARDYPLRGLLIALHSRGYVVGCDFGDRGGIHGWLDPAETAQLFCELDKLDLPRYTPSYAEMKRQHRGSCTDERLTDLYWDRLSLSFVRTVSYLAREHGRGLLWGNDMLTANERRKLYSRR